MAFIRSCHYVQLDSYLNGLTFVFLVCLDKINWSAVQRLPLTILKRSAVLFLYTVSFRAVLRHVVPSAQEYSTLKFEIDGRDLYNSTIFVLFLT